MIQELLGGAAMDQLKSSVNPASLPMLLHPAAIVSNPSPTSSRSSAHHHHQQQQQRSTSATSSPQQGPGPQQGAPAPEQTPLRCPRCNSSNTKFCYYNNYNLTQPRHFCKTCRRYWTKGGALRNVPIGGGCRKPRPMPLPVAKPAVVVSACGKAAVGAGAGGPSLGLGVGFGGMGMAMGPGGTWASSQQAAAAQLMALLNSARSGGAQQGGNMHRFLGLDSMAHHLPLHVLHGAGNSNAGFTAPSSLWPPQQAAPRAMPTPPPPPPPHMDSQLGMGQQHDVLASLGLKLPPPSSSSSSPSPAAASCYYSDQLHAVVSSAAAAAGGRGHEYEAAAAAGSGGGGCATSQLPCTTALTSLPPAASSGAATFGFDFPPPVSSLPASEIQYWAGAAAMSMAWPELPTPNGAFP